MPNLSKWRIARHMAAAATAGLGVVAAGSGVALAGYGPPPPPNPPPGGFSCVITSQTVGPAGKTISFRLGPVSGVLIIPRGDFSKPVQITITEPFGTGSCSGGPGPGDAGFPGFRTLVGVGIQVQRGSKTVTSFARPLVLRLGDNAQIRPGDLLVAWNGTGFQGAPGFYTHDAITTEVRSSTDYALLVPDGRGRRGGGRGGFGPFGTSRHTTALQGDYLAAALLLPSGAHPGLGVLTPLQLRETSVRARLLTR